MLTACAARTEGVDLQVGRVYFNIDLLRLGQDCDGDCRSVYAPHTLGLGHALDAVDAALEFEAGIRALAAYHETYFFVSAEFSGVRAEDFGFEALCVAVHRVHSEQHAREQRGFLAACAAAYLNDNIAVVVRVAREQEHFQILLSALDIFFRFFELGARKLLEFGIRAALFEQALRLLGVIFRRFIFAVFFNYG